MKCEMDNLEKIKEARKEFIERLGKWSKFIFHRPLEISRRVGVVKTKCYDCSCYLNTKNNITECGSFTCALYFHRPYHYSDTNEVKDLICEGEKEFLPKVAPPSKCFKPKPGLAP